MTSVVPSRYWAPESHRYSSEALRARSVEGVGLTGEQGDLTPGKGGLSVLPIVDDSSVRSRAGDGGEAQRHKVRLLPEEVSSYLSHYTITTLTPSHPHMRSISSLSAAEISVTAAPSLILSSSQHRYSHRAAPSRT